MAKTKTPFFSFGSRGSVGESITTQKRGRDTLVRRSPVPTDPESPAQLIQRARYLRVIQFWNGLSPAQKQAWNSEAVGLNIPGMGLFIRRYMPLTAGLVLYYPLNDMSSVEARDYGTLATPGTIFGATPTAGCFGGALLFDGNNDWINSSTGLTATLNASFSLAAWTKRGELNDYHSLLSHGDWPAAANHHLYFRYNQNNKFKFGFTGDDLDTAIAYGDLDTWVRWLGTYNHITKDRRLYRNRVLVANDIAVGDYAGHTSEFTVGVRATSHGQWMHGIIDEPMVWDRVLSQALVTLDAERGTP